jgi:UDP-N-acetylglucosamine acyltransferase
VGANEVRIHPTAIVEAGAELGIGVEIGPYAIIGPKVKVGDHSTISSHAVLSGRTRLGARNRVSPFATLGTTPQDLKYKGEDAELICGDDNMFREYSNVSIGTEGGGGKTVIGNRNLFMMNTHIAHDCIVGSSCILANGATLAGHIEVDDKAVIGGLAAIHQFVKIGTLAMLGGGSMVSQDIPPYVMVAGNHARPTGINKLGLQRAGFSTETISSIRKIYRTLYQSSLTIDEAKTQLESSISETSEAKTFLSFLDRSQRGICR